MHSPTPFAPAIFLEISPYLTFFFFLEIMNNLELERLLNENLAQTELTITRLTVLQVEGKSEIKRSLRVSPQAKP